MSKAHNISSAQLDKTKSASVDNMTIYINVESTDSTLVKIRRQVTCVKIAKLQKTQTKSISLMKYPIKN